MSGEPVTRKPRPYDDEELSWLIQDSGAALGERGVSLDPSGGGGRVVASTDPYHEQFIQRCGLDMKGENPVGRQARLLARWRLLSRGHQRALEACYSTRRTWPPGFETVFQGYQSIAVLLHRDAEELARWCGSAKKHEKQLGQLFKRAERLCRSAHEAWRDTAVSQATKDVAAFLGDT